MGKQRFIVPSVVRLDLTEGDWIEVKRALSYREALELSTGAFKKMSANVMDMKSEDKAEIVIDWGEQQIVRLYTWIVDWSFKDDKDKPVKVTRDALRNLDPETAIELHAALDVYIEHFEAEKKEADKPGTAAAKNGTGSARTSTSRAG